MALLKSTEIYEAIKSGNTNQLINLLNKTPEDALARDKDGSTYLHLVVKEHTTADLLLELIPYCDIAARDLQGHTALDLLLLQDQGVVRDTSRKEMIQVFTDHIMNVILDADRDRLGDLVQKGWDAWPIRPLDDLEEYQDAVEYLRGINDLPERTMEIHEHAQNGDVEALKCSLLADCDLENRRDLAGMTVLHKAVIFQQPDTVQFILNRTDTQNLTLCTDHMGRTSLHYAAVLDNEDIYETLAPKSDLQQADNLDKSAEYYRVHREQLNIEKTQRAVLFLMQLPELQETVNNIHEAVVKDDLIRLKQLLDRGKLAVVRDSSGMGPLHKAVLYEHADIVRHLLSIYPDAINVTDNWKRSALHYAAVVPDRGYLYKLLTSAGADEQLHDEKQKTPQYYLDHKDEINVKNIKEIIAYLPIMMEYQTNAVSLHAAVVSDDLAKVKHLLTRRGMVETRDSSGLTVLHKAVVYEHSDVIRFILSTQQHSVNVTDHMGRTAAHYAATLSDKGYLINLLQKAGADTSIKDLAGNTVDYYLKNKTELDIKALKARLDKPAGLRIRPVFISRPPSSRRSTRIHSANSQHSERYERQRQPVREDPYQRLRAPPPTTDEARYIAQNLGVVLTLTLSEIAEKRPHDPIEFLAHALYKYAQNIRHQEKQAEIQEQLNSELTHHEESTRRQKSCIEEVKSMKRDEEKKRAEDEAEKQRVHEEEEKERRQRDESVAQPPHLPTLREADEEDITTMKDEYGQLELHRAAQQADVNLTELLHQGYNIAERDINGKTARDLAVTAGLVSHVEAIDNHVVDLFQRGQFSTLEKLLLDGYHGNLPNISDKIPHDQLDENSKHILDEMDAFQEKIHEIQKHIEDGHMKRALQALDRKQLAFCKDEKGRTPLHNLILTADVTTIKALLARFPTTITAKDKMNRTPLHYANAISDDIVDILIKAGANANAKDVKQRPPSYYKDKKDELDD